MDTSFGRIEVCEVNASSESKIGTSRLNVLFSENYGIIRMAYNILDKYEIIFELKGIEKL